MAACLLSHTSVWYSYLQVSRLSELGMFILEEKNLQEDHVAAFQYLKGAYRKGVVIEQSVMVSN